MPSKFLNRFRRITYSTSYLPEVDGLRFLAIFSVVVVMHITNYMNEKFYNDELVTSSYWKNFMVGGGSGVPLFFMISGFILSLPFAKWRLNGDKPVYLKRYFLRRVTRLEPPYLSALIIFFIANIWIVGKHDFNQQLPHLLASAVYLHNFIYGSISTVLPVAWSLEIEVQFYILAPLFCLVFLIRNDLARWILQFSVILFSAVYWFDTWNVLHVFVYLHYFFSGILLADLYCRNIRIIKNEKPGLLVGIVALLGFLFIPSLKYMPGYFIKIACMFFLFHTALTNVYVKKIFSVPALVITGGMCYSIYLLHLGIISATGRMLIQSGIEVSNHSLVPVFVLLFIAIVLIGSALFFILVEKPFMKPMGLKEIKGLKQKQV